MNAELFYVLGEKGKGGLRWRLFRVRSTEINIVVEVTAGL